MSEQQYHLRWMGKQSGPYTVQQINDLLDRHEINTMYQIYLDEQWSGLGDFLEKFEKEEEIERKRREAEQEQEKERDKHRLEAARLENERVQMEMDQQAALDRETKAQEAADVDLHGKKYFLHIKGEKKGPYNQAAVLVMLNGGKITHQTLAWTKEVGEWVPLSGYPDFSQVPSPMSGSMPASGSMPVSGRPLPPLQHPASTGYPPTHGKNPSPYRRAIQFLVTACLVAGIGFIVYHFIHNDGELPDLMSGQTDEESLVDKVAFVVCGLHFIDIDGKKKDVVWGNGSGFLVSQDGYVFTNKHVVETVDNRKRATKVMNHIKEKANLEELEPKIWVFFGENNKYEADIIHISEDFDFAILKAHGLRDASFFKLSSDKMFSRGMEVETLGFPGTSMEAITDDEAMIQRMKEARAQVVQDYFQKSDFDYVQKSGKISVVKDREETGMVIEHDAAISPGNSGGPLVNQAGVVVGINTWYMPKSGVQSYFSLLIEQLRSEIEREGIEVKWD